MMIKTDLKRVGIKYCAAVIGIACGLTVLLPLTVLAQNQNPGVLPPQSAPHGLTYGEWSAKWWKWAVEPPPAQNPLIDMTGANCAVGQSGHVWFLAGTSGGTVTRICTIPHGQMLFFPIGNAFCAGDGIPFADERACATAFAAGFSNFAAEVDGVPIKGLNVGLLANPYRALSPEFDLVLSADNIFSAPAGTYAPGAADGVYLMLAPLKPGPHKIHFHADGANGTDATYYLTVGPLN